MGKTEYEKGLEVTLALANYWAFKYGNLNVSSKTAIKNNKDRGYLYDPYRGSSSHFKGNYHIHLLWQSDRGARDKSQIDGYWFGLSKVGPDNERYIIKFDPDYDYQPKGEYIKNLAGVFESLLEMPVMIIEDFDNNRLDKNSYKIVRRFYEEKYRNYDDIAKENWMN